MERSFLATSRSAAAASGSPTAASASAAAERVRQLWYDQRRAYRQLRNRKCVILVRFTTATNARDMWATVDRLLQGRGHRACDGVSANDLLTS